MDLLRLWASMSKVWRSRCDSFRLDHPSALHLSLGCCRVRSLGPKMRTDKQLMNEMLKRYPSMILRRAITHVRKRKSGTANVIILRVAIMMVEQAELERVLDKLRRQP
jgi:hypothetical protein